MESSNIILDPTDFEPKISNIGLTRDAQENVDVYNYGILVVEIVSGKKENYNHDFQSVASDLHARESLLLDFVDKRLTDYKCCDEQVITVL
ncbi:conserved hypothetical protein [Ricinus communis]|uniref:Protein kinase domain-containing protein n=1 Tax=Ricinus communis TaxID=3988 RepID=B9RTC6_RICCO|nr:conserved hypothetical protein [Ricinus communis]